MASIGGQVDPNQKVGRSKCWVRDGMPNFPFAKLQITVKARTLPEQSQKVPTASQLFEKNKVDVAFCDEFELQIRQHWSNLLSALPKSRTDRTAYAATQKGRIDPCRLLPSFRNLRLSLLIP